MSRSEDDNGAGGPAGAGPPSALEPARQPPAFNIPGAVLATAAVLLAITAVTDLWLDPLTVSHLFELFGFRPLRYFDPGAFAGGVPALVWTPISYAFLHAGWEHVGFNVAWLTVFGSPVARRYGTGGFVLLAVASTVIAAFGFAVFNLQRDSILIGASGGISGLTGAALRFAFQPIEMGFDPATGEPVVLGKRLASPLGALRNRRVLTLLVVIVGLNVGVWVYALAAGAGTDIGWQAHVAGLAAGYFLVGPVERWVSSRRAAQRP